MKEGEPTKTTRRDLLTGGVRLLALGGMAAYATAQTLKARRLENDPNCIRLYTCDDCVEFASGCKLPKAYQFREQHPNR